MDNTVCKFCNKLFLSKGRIYCCERCKSRDNGYRERLNTLLSANFDEEDWVDIKGYEGIYMVSTRGRIKSVDRQSQRTRGLANIKGRVLRPNIYKNGYLWVLLTKDKNPLQFFVHRIVATHLVENSKNLPFVNHIDGDKANNDTLNLEWCTPKQNVHHALNTGLCENIFGDNCHLSSLSSEQVLLIRSEYTKGDNIEKIAKQYNVHGHTIRRVIERKTWRHI
jgi:hypothetical protein